MSSQCLWGQPLVSCPAARSQRGPFWAPLALAKRVVAVILRGRPLIASVENIRDGGDTCDVDDVDTFLGEAQIVIDDGQQDTVGSR